MYVQTPTPLYLAHARTRSSRRSYQWTGARSPLGCESPRKSEVPAHSSDHERSNRSIVNTENPVIMNTRPSSAGGPRRAACRCSGAMPLTVDFVSLLLGVRQACADCGADLGTVPLAHAGTRLYPAI